MTTVTTPPTPDRLSWLIAALQAATERRDWRTARDHAREASAIAANRERFAR